MLTTYGADWFSRRAGSCRLHAIYLNQLRVYMEIAGEIVKHAAPLTTRQPRQPMSGFTGVKQPCHRNLETAEFDPISRHQT
jgi:hypothetical protein